MDVRSALEQLTINLSAVQKETLKEKLALYLNDLLLHDFSSLVQVLYQVDVPEKKVKTVLLQNPGKDAGMLMAELIIERQQQKVEARKNFRSNNEEDTGEERW